MIRATRSREFFPSLQITEQEIKVKVQVDMDRRMRFKERVKILEDNLKEIIDSRLALMFDLESYNDMRNYIDVSNNLMRRVIRETSTLYCDEHERTVTPQAQQKTYEEVIGPEGLDLNTRLAKYQYELNGLNDLLIKIEGAGGELDLTKITPDQVTVFENPINPLMLDALVIEDCYTDTDGQKKRRWIFWSPTRHFLLDDQFRKIAVLDNPEMVNPYWRVNTEQEVFYPFIGLHNGEREKCFWDQFTGTDLVEATKTIAIKNTFLYFMFPMQFKQIAAKGTFDDKSEFKNRQIKSPLHILKSNQELTVLDWQSSLKQLDECVQGQLFQVASNHGISAENFKLTAVETSGFARMISKERLLEIRKDQVPTWRRFEEELFDGSRVAIDLYDLRKEKISPTAKFGIDYTEPQFIEDPAAELDLQEKKIELGLINPLDLIKQENPDIKTDEEAEAILVRNIQIRNRIRSRLGLGQNSLTTGQPPGNPVASAGVQR